ncbi:hypothetical protein GCM10022212_05050 [Actimicrobium antarcticum]|uniref:Uncharacterized protein n=2 Tax=Actimicrobium antarcticum TaxID=1051899 RepID=A0ABP7SMQ9_9BURK
MPPSVIGTPVAPADRQGIADWLKNNLPPWLQAMLGITGQGDHAEQAPVQRNERRSAYAADILADDANLWSDGVTLDEAGLQDIVDHPEKHEPDTVRAAQILLNHPGQLAKIIAGANGSNTGRTISPEGLARYSKHVTMQTPPAVNNAAHPSRAWQHSADAAEILAGDDNLWKGKSYLDIGDLKDIVNHPEQHSPDTTHAAKVMLRNLPQFSLADGINTNGARDGEVWRRDLTSFATSVPATVVAPTVAFDTTNQDFMQRALASVAARAQLQQATTMGPFPANMDPMPSMARQSLLADTKLWEGKATLTPQDLANVLLHPTDYAPDTVTAAMYMLTHPEAFHDEDPAVAANTALNGQVNLLQTRLETLQAQLDAETAAALASDNDPTT